MCPATTEHYSFVNTRPRACALPIAGIVLYWRRCWHVAAGLLGWKQGAVACTRNILLGFLPSAVIGLFVYKMVKAMLDQPIIVAVMLIVGGVELGSASWREIGCHYV